MLKTYYQLTKPGIIYGNVFTTLAGFLFASRWHFSFVLLLATLFGIAFVIASACVFNNYIDRDIDKKMTRTKDRALVSGIIPAWSALLYAAVLGVLGFYLLYAQVNSLTALIALVGFIFYIVLYAIAKRASHWGTVVGSVSGAVPIVVGYTAITDRIDTAAIILFSTLVLWQMPHFYAIATYRLDEYVAAGIPVLPAKKGMRTTKLYIVGYIIAFIIAMSLLTVFGYTGYSYLIVVSLVGLVWLWYGIRGFKVSNDALWARKTFLFSLIMLVVFSVMVSVGALLP